jgi:proteic killer suppression protein
MIKQFGDKETSGIWYGLQSKKLPFDIQQVARRKLRMINNSADLNDLKVPPSNRLEKLKGKLKDYNSIRINKQYRVIFRWESGDAYDVKIVDYHQNEVYEKIN